MTELRNTEAIKERLKSLAKVNRTTHKTLAQIVRYPARRPTPELLRRFSRSLEYTAQVHEGFVLSQRVSPQFGLAELHRLSQPMLLDWQWVESLNLSVMPDDEVKAIHNQLIAYQQATMALGALPNLPIGVITFPQPRPSYADISAPRTPGQILERIEEIEHVIYQAGIVPLDQLAWGAVRRTYAFFEANVWLVDQYPPSLLALPPQS